jgi:hypothetical protein
LRSSSAHRPKRKLAHDSALCFPAGFAVGDLVISSVTIGGSSSIVTVALEGSPMP